MGDRRTDKLVGTDSGPDFNADRFCSGSKPWLPIPDSEFSYMDSLIPEARSDFVRMAPGTMVQLGQAQAWLEIGG
jgi:hypothetical protein